EAWLPKDPIKYGDRLVTAGVLSQGQLNHLVQDVEGEIDEAVNFAEESPDPKPEDALDGVFAPMSTIPDTVVVEPDQGDRLLSLGKAINEALTQGMERDPGIFVLGEDVATLGGDFGVTRGLLEKYGPERAFDTPLSETAIIGVSVGAAIQGQHPVAEIMFSDFLGCAMDQIINQAAKFHYMFGEQVNIPLVIRTAYGAGISASSQHSQSLESLFTHIPGLKVVMPASPYDAKGLMTTALLDNNPVMFFEHKLLYG
ncbi:unnamed protein product, partial [marine sediment metagenome]